MKLTKKSGEWISERWEGFKNIYPSVKILYGLLFTLLITTGFSVFASEKLSNDNMVVMRSAFSSILGYMLEASTKKVDCDDKCIMLKSRMVGAVSFFCWGIIIHAHMMNLNKDNPSLILIKNTLLATIGYLISSAKVCGYPENKQVENTTNYKDSNNNESSSSPINKSVSNNDNTERKN